MPIKAERIWVEDGYEYPYYYAEASEDCTEYVRGDLVAAKDAEIERLTLSSKNSEWICVCGWINGCDLSICARCSRNPQEGYAVLRADIVAEKDAEIELLRGDLKGAQQRWHLACEDIAKRDAEIERLNTALGKINAIRNSIVGAQAVNWSEHIYPLVAALSEAGIAGLPYPEAKKNIGTLIDRNAELCAEIERLKGLIEKAEGLMSQYANIGFYGWLMTQGSDCDPTKRAEEAIAYLREGIGKEAS